MVFSLSIFFVYLFIHHSLALAFILLRKAWIHILPPISLSFHPYIAVPSSASRSSIHLNKQAWSLLNTIVDGLRSVILFTYVTTSLWVHYCFGKANFRRCFWKKFWWLHFLIWIFPLRVKGQCRHFAFYTARVSPRILHTPLVKTIAQYHVVAHSRIDNRCVYA